MHYNENAASLGFAKAFSTNVSKSQFRQNSLLPKFCTIRYITKFILAEIFHFYEIYIALQKFGAIQYTVCY